MFVRFRSPSSFRRRSSTSAGGSASCPSSSPGSTTAPSPWPGRSGRSPATRFFFRSASFPKTSSSRRAGVALSPATGGAVVDETFMTTVPGIFPAETSFRSTTWPTGLPSRDSKRGRTPPGSPGGTPGNGRRRPASPPERGSSMRPAADRPARNGRSRPLFPDRGAAPERLDRGPRPIERNDAVPEKISPPPSLGASADRGEGRDRGGPGGFGP